MFHEVVLNVNEYLNLELKTDSTASNNFFYLNEEYMQHSEYACN